MEESWSHPMWVRGLKLTGRDKFEASEQSHPMWVRGLKLMKLRNTKSEYQSHPMWVRGLKHDGNLYTRHTP